MLLPPNSPSPSNRSADSPVGGHDFDHSGLHRFSQPSSSEHSPSSVSFGLPPMSTGVNDHLSTSSAQYNHPVYTSQHASFSAPNSGYMSNVPEGAFSQPTTSTPREQQLEHELARLQNKLREVEYLHEQDRQKLFELQS